MLLIPIRRLNDLGLQQNMAVGETEQIVGLYCCQNGVYGYHRMCRIEFVWRDVRPTKANKGEEKKTNWKSP